MLNLCTTTYDAYTPSIATLHGGAGCINTTHLRADSGLTFGLQNLINRPAVYADLRQLRTDGKQLYVDRHDATARHADFATIRGDAKQLYTDYRAPAPPTPTLPAPTPTLPAPADDLQNLKFSLGKALDITEKAIPVAKDGYKLYKAIRL